MNILAIMCMGAVFSLYAMDDWDVSGTNNNRLKAMALPQKDLGEQLYNAIIDDEIWPVYKALHNGANVNAMYCGSTPLLTAITLDGDPNIVELLLKHKADPNVQFLKNVLGIRQVSPLAIATNDKNGRKYGTVADLLDYGSKDLHHRGLYNALSNYAYTPNDANKVILAKIIAIDPLIKKPAALEYISREKLFDDVQRAIVEKFLAAVPVYQN